MKSLGRGNSMNPLFHHAIPCLTAALLAGCGPNPFSSLKPGLNPGAVAALEKVEQLAAEGKIDEALEKSNLALILLEKGFIPDPEFLADTQVAHGHLLLRNRKFSEGLKYFDAAIIGYGKLKNREGKLGIAMAHSGDAMFNLGNTDEAKKRLFAATQILEKAGYGESMVALGAMTSMSGIAIQENRLNDAEEFLNEALKACRGDKRVTPTTYCNVLNNLGEVYFLRGDYAKALQFYTEAHEMAVVKIPSFTWVIAVYAKNIENAKAKLKK